MNGKKILTKLTVARDFNMVFRYFFLSIGQTSHDQSEPIVYCGVWVQAERGTMNRDGDGNPIHELLLRVWERERENSALSRVCVCAYVK